MIDDDIEEENDNDVPPANEVPFAPDDENHVMKSSHPVLTTF